MAGTHHNSEHQPFMARTKGNRTISQPNPEDTTDSEDDNLQDSQEIIEDRKRRISKRRRIKKVIAKGHTNNKDWRIIRPRHPKF